tara:strand:+ start:314 stop:706 length:393 start_codon:yes stop_codon:yes gene_type:complete
MSNIDYKKKYLKYKNKHILNTKINQKGGERHETVIRKDGDNISFPNGFPNLQTNGDYHIVHAYDETLTSSRTMSEKVNILNVWLTQTFPGAGGPPQDNNDHINKAYNIYNSDQRQNLIDLVNWILDPTDN